MLVPPASPQLDTLNLFNVKVSPCNTTSTKWEIHVAASSIEKANRLAIQWITQNLPSHIKKIDGIPCINCDEVCSVSRIGSGSKSIFPYVADVTGMNGFVLTSPKLQVNERVAFSEGKATPLWSVTLEEHPYPLYVVASDFFAAGTLAKQWLHEVTIKDELVEASLRQDLYDEGLEELSNDEIILDGAMPILAEGMVPGDFDDIFDVSVTSVERLDSFVVMDENASTSTPRSSVPALGEKLQ